MTAGSILLMWIGELITEQGIGNGISLIIFAGIVSQLPNTFGTLINSLLSTTKGKLSIFGWFDVPVDPTTFWLLLVTPPVHVSTGWAFGQLEGSGSLIPVDEAIAKPLNEWQGLLLNDFQLPIARAIPQVAEVLERMATLAPSYYALSGSGPSVFGLFPRRPECPESLFPECHVSVTQLAW